MLAGRSVDIEPLGGVSESEGIPDLKPSFARPSRMVRPYQSLSSYEGLQGFRPPSGASHTRWYGAQTCGLQATPVTKSGGTLLAPTTNHFSAVEPTAERFPNVEPDRACSDCPCEYSAKPKPADPLPRSHQT